jgi:hypothetical protein
MVALILLDDKINKHYSGSGTKLDRKLGKLIRGLKQEGDFISGILIFL